MSTSVHILNKFYVYEHIRLDTNEVFYVGKGTGRRAYETKGDRRSEHWKRVHNKVGSYVKLLVENVDEELAFLVEIERIDQLKKLNTPLINKTIGGDGATGYKHSEESKAKISISNKTRYAKMTKEEKVWSESKRNNALAGMKRYYSTHTLPPKSDEVKRKISETKKANPTGTGKWMNNGSVNAKVSPIEIDKYTQMGWDLGMLRNHITEEYKQKLKTAAIKQWERQRVGK